MKKTIAIAEILYPVGHKPIDKKIVDILAEEYNLVVLNYRQFLDETRRDLPNVQYIELPRQIIIKKHQPFIQAGIRYNLHVIKKALRNIDFDAILFLSCNNALLGLMRREFGDKRIFVMHHNDIDALKTEKQLSAFRKGMNSVEHITVADFISEGLSKKTGCPIERIYTVPHPITSKVLDCSDLNNRQKLLVGLGLSNDEGFIDRCIEIDKELKAPLSYSIVLRSTEKEYVGTSLKVIKGYLDDKTYNDYYYNAEAIIVCYPNHFENRYSATLIFAVAQNGKVIFNDFPMGRVESKKYPKIMRAIKEPKELFSIEDDYFGSPVDYADRARFLDDHSDKRVTEEFRAIFK